MSDKFDPTQFSISQIVSFEFLPECPACSGSEYFCKECAAKVELIHAEMARREAADPDWYALECQIADAARNETAVPDFTAHIDSSDERAAAWLRIFDDTAVPLRSPIPHLARLPGRGEELVYLLDIEALTADQRGRLVQHIAGKFDIPAAEVDADLDTHGCPILAEHVTVSIANPWRWL